jgi:hypothetical protein
MFANPLGTINDAPGKTATELALRQRNLAEEIGPIFTRLQQEFLQRIMQRIIYILRRKGKIDDIVINEQAVALRYKSPLTISQGQQDVQAFMQYQQIIQQIMGPEAALTYLKTTKVPAWIAKKLGVDPNTTNTEEEMQQLFEAKQNEQQQLQLAGAMSGQQQPG